MNLKNRKIFFLLLSYLLYLNRVFYFKVDKINLIASDDRLISLYDYKYFEWFWDYIPTVFYRKMFTRYKQSFDERFSIFGRFVFKGYHTEKMLNKPHIWVHKVYKWKPPFMPLSFHRPKLPRLGLTIYDFDVAHVPFQFVHMFDHTLHPFVLSKFWYMPRKIERLRVQRYWRRYKYLIKYFCKFFNLTGLAHPVAKQAMIFYSRICSASLLIRKGVKQYINYEVDPRKDFERFSILFMKIYSSDFFKGLPLFRKVFLLFITKIDFIYKFNCFAFLHFLPFFHRFYDDIKAFLYNTYLDYNLFVYNIKISIYLEILINGVVVDTLTPAMFSSFFFYYKKHRALKRSFKVIKYEFYSLRLDSYSAFLYWSSAEFLRWFKYRENLMYSYTMNFFSYLRHMLIRRDLGRPTKPFYRPFKFYRIFYLSGRDTVYRVNFSFRLKNYPMNLIFFDHFSHFFNANSNLFFLSKLKDYSLFFSTVLYKLYRGRIHIHAHKYFQQLSLFLTYKYKLYKIHYRNFMDNYLFLRHYNYSYLLSTRFIPFYSKTYIEKLIKDLLKPFYKHFFFYDFIYNVYNEQKKFYVDSFIIESCDELNIFYDRSVYVILQSIVSTNLFCQNLEYLLYLNEVKYQDILLIFDEFFDHIFTMLFIEVDPDDFLEIWFFYFNLEMVLWRFFYFDTLIHFLRKDLQNIFVFRKLDIDLIFYSRLKVFRDLIYYSLQKNHLYVGIFYHNLHKDHYLRYVKDFFRFNVFFKFASMKSFLFKLFSKSISYAVACLFILKNKWNFFRVNFVNFFTFFELDKVIYRFKCRHLFKAWNHKMKIYDAKNGDVYTLFMNTTFREYGIRLGIFQSHRSTGVQAVDWKLFVDTCWWDKPLFIPPRKEKFYTS